MLVNVCSKYRHSNTFYVLNTKSSVLKQGCHSFDCKYKYRFIYSPTPLYDFDVSETGLAKLFLELNPEIFSQKIDNKMVAFIYMADLGIFHVDIDDVMLTKCVVGEFMEHLNFLVQQMRDTIDFNDKHQAQQYMNKKNDVEKLKV